VTVGGSPRPVAVLDTSFWATGYRAEIVANCLDLFLIVVPHAVEAEIRSVQVGAPRREYPYATLFRHLRDKMFDPPDDAPRSPDRFGAGEAAAIPLAQHLGVPLLINEWRATAYAARIGIRVLTVPAVIVLLRMRDVISDRAARRKLELIASNPAPAMILEATQHLNRLAPPYALDADEP
jgi:predicted nucleic acid-binding protein